MTKEISQSPDIEYPAFFAGMVVRCMITELPYGNPSRDPPVTTGMMLEFVGVVGACEVIGAAGLSGCAGGMACEASPSIASLEM